MNIKRDFVRIWVLCAAMLTYGAQAQFLFVTSNNVITITGYTDSNSTVAVPKKISGLPVGIIGTSAFASSTNLTSVTLPDSVTTISSSAFYNCTGLTNVTLGNGVTTIGNYAFEYCSNLANVTIPASIKSLGTDAFSCCYGLMGVYFQGNAFSVSGSPFNSDSHAVVYYFPWTTGWGTTFGGTPTVSYVPPVPFNYTTNDGAITVTEYTGSGGVVTVPGTIYVTGVSNFLPVTTVGANAFNGCSGLFTVVIPGGVTNLGSYAFSGCSNLIGVFFASNAPSADATVFLNDDNVFVYYLPGTTGWWPFFAGAPTVQWPYLYTITNGTIVIRSYTGSGGAVTIPGAVGGLPVTSIGNGAFAFCSNLTSVTMPDSITELGCFAFFGCSNLTTATLSTNLQYIGVSLFDSCINLTNVSIPDGVFIIGASAFQNCASLGSVTIPNTVTTIGNFAFQNCASLASVAIPASVKAIPKTVVSFTDGIGWDAFGACASLQSITVDPQNTNYSSLDGVLFDRNQGTLVQYPGGKAGNYNIPSSVSGIAPLAFDSCAALTSVNWNDTASTISIGDWAFDCCMGLTSVNFPYPTTSIKFGSYVFESCRSLKSIITSVSTSDSIGYHPFDGCTGLTEATIYTGTTFPGFNGGIPFYDCTNLTTIYLAGTYPWLTWNPTNQSATPIAYCLPRADTSRVYIPRSVWLPKILKSDAGFGFTSNQFGFNINWSSRSTIVVEACTNLTNPIWMPMVTNTINDPVISGSTYFSDAQWTNYPGRFYRIGGTYVTQ
jgi:hypothetical protein